MKILRDGKEWYPLEIVTEPSVGAWEASFDDGETWVASTEVGTDGYARWLIAGPDAAPGDAVVITKTTKPIIRAIDNPEIITRLAPPIYVQ